MQFEITKSDKPFTYDLSTGFGSVHVPLMLSCDVSMDRPTPEVVTIAPTTDLVLDPFCAGIHYGQSIFEGLKAYKTSKGESVVYRGEAHMQRFIRSAKIMQMAPLTLDFLNECLEKYIDCMKEYIPTEPGHALYLRPIMFANDAVMKVQSSQNYKFLIMGSIVGDYFANKADKRTKVMVSDKYVRALPGGTGEAKTAANYAQSLPALKFANSLGYQQVIYVDSATKKNIEELGGMNFFWVEQGTLCTPPLNGQILHGITRDSILEIANLFGINTQEKEITVDDLIAKTKSGTISEVFASGTAAVMTGLNEIGICKDDKIVDSLEFSDFPIMDRIKEHLLATQRGETDLSKKYLKYL
jgi:branched-chain amino acid aminotransferase